LKEELADDNSVVAKFASTAEDGKSTWRNITA